MFRLRDTNRQILPPMTSLPYLGLVVLRIATSKSIFPKTREGDAHPFYFFVLLINFSSNFFQATGCRHPNPLYRSAAASAALGISSKIGKAHLLFCSPPAIRSWEGEGDVIVRILPTTMQRTHNPVERPKTREGDAPTNYHAKIAQPC